MNLLQRSHSTHNPSTSSTPGKDQNVISALLSENLQSPNAIPPRTSSTTALLNGDRAGKPLKRASTSVLRPISETDWLSQGKRVSQEPLGKHSRRSTGPSTPASHTPVSPPRRMEGSRDGTPVKSTETVPGPSKERPTSDGYGEIPTAQGRVNLVDVLPQRKSSRHKLSSSLESNKSGRAPASQPSHRGSSSAQVSPEKLQRFRDDLIHQRRQTWSPDKERILLGPYSYLLGHPGKDIRAQLIDAFNEWLRVPEQSLAVITRVVGMLHTASLL